MSKKNQNHTQKPNLGKQILYFLLAGDAEHTKRMLKNRHFPIVENKHFPKSFLTFSQKAFERNQKKLKINRSSSAKEEPFFFWKNFCRHHSYQEVLPVLLHGILQCPQEQIGWLLNLSPETLSYRLNQGLLALQEEITSPHPSQAEGEKQSSGLSYCHWLSQQSLPEWMYSRTQKQIFPAPYLKILLLAFMAGLFISLVVWIVMVVFFSGPVMLYPSSE